MAVIVFDNDDTLSVGCAAIYAKAQMLFYLYLHEIFGKQIVSYSDLNNIYQLAESEAIPYWGVKRGRVAYSMLKTYWAVYEWADKRFNLNFSDKEHVKHGTEIQKLGNLPFDHAQIQWFPEAPELLERLKLAGHTLCLLTNYDSEEWPKRAALLGVEKFFDKERVLAVSMKKTREDFIKVSNWSLETDKNNLWIAVGNSPKSDVLPAAGELGISDRWYGIHIPYGGNSSPHTKDEGGVNLWPTINHPQVINIASLKELESAINQLSSKSAS